MPRKRQIWNTKEWRDLKRKVLFRDNYHCLRCNKRFRSEILTAHHLVPREDGGSNDITNLVTMCYECHDIAEIYNLRTSVDIIGSMPDLPPVIPESRRTLVSVSRPLPYDPLKASYKEFIDTKEVRNCLSRAARMSGLIQCTIDELRGPLVKNEGYIKERRVLRSIPLKKDRGYRIPSKPIEPTSYLTQDESIDRMFLIVQKIWRDMNLSQINDRT